MLLYETIEWKKPIRRSVPHAWNGEYELYINMFCQIGVLMVFSLEYSLRCYIKSNIKEIGQIYFRFYKLCHLNRFSIHWISEKRLLFHQNREMQSGVKKTSEKSVQFSYLEEIQIRINFSLAKI